jgi:hypothetical protein
MQNWRPQKVNRKWNDNDYTVSLPFSLQLVERKFELKNYATGLVYIWCWLSALNLSGHYWFSAHHSLNGASNFHFSWKLFFLKKTLFLCLWLYSPSVLGSFFSILILYTVGRTHWTGISQSQICYLHTEQLKHRINANRHQCPEWDSNPDSNVRAGEDGLWLRSRGHCDRS